MSAHRVIVAAGSPVFHAMLYVNMKESSQNEIELPIESGRQCRYKNFEDAAFLHIHWPYINHLGKLLLLVTSYSLFCH